VALCLVLFELSNAAPEHQPVFIADGDSLIFFENEAVFVVL
jgi:hypothetical protein